MEGSRVADPDPVESGPFWSDPEPDQENFHRIRIRIRTLSVLWLCKVVKTRKIDFKNRAFTHFQVNFPIFPDKNNHHSNIRRNLIDVNIKFDV